MYGVHKVEMPLPGCCVSSITLMLIYGATNMKRSQRDKTLPLVEEIQFQSP
jgi:hypothetical protein